MTRKQFIWIVTMLSVAFVLNVASMFIRSAHAADGDIPVITLAKAGDAAASGSGGGVAIVVLILLIAGGLVFLKLKHPQVFKRGQDAGDKLATQLHEAVTKALDNHPALQPKVEESAPNPGTTVPKQGTPAPYVPPYAPPAVLEPPHVFNPGPAPAPPASVDDLLAALNAKLAAAGKGTI